MSTDPFALFDSWFADAEAGEPNDPNAMCVSTVAADGQPSSRMVLLKGRDAGGFVFYTNGESQKAQELTANPRAALLFHWKSLRRQVRITGPVEQVAAADADAYFASRGRDSQIGAVASDQSRPLASRALFEERFAKISRRFADRPVPRPPHWGGYRVVANAVEFWQDRPHRLHERRLFTRSPDGGWTEGLLFP